LLSRGNIFKSIYDKSKGTDSELISALNALIDLIADHLKVIRVNVIDTDDAYMIFEILNARGINLSPVDLIKNKLLASWGTAYPIDFALSKWTDISNNLSSRANSVSIDDYAVHHWTTIYPYT
ncbi:GmrSD restriction endonuclease domain-containing protein, partial [Aeromonas veronii]